MCFINYNIKYYNKSSMLKIIKEKEIILYLILSVLFAFTIQQFPFFKGNSLHLLHAIKDFDTNKLQNDWVANQTNHLPVFTYLNNIFIQVFSIKILHVIHFSLLVICPFYIFLVCKNEFQNLNKTSLLLIWFSIFIIIYHEHSFFGGLAGQDIINEGYQPASFGVLFYCGIYLFLIRKYFLSILLICLSASFHPSYVLHSGLLFFGFSFYLVLAREFKTLLKLLIYYIILISPITLYIFLNFLLLDKELIQMGQNILVERIPHHALIENWFSYKDFFSILIYLISLLIIHKNKKIFVPLTIFGISSILLSILQFITENYTLALAFPWRASVVLIPLSSMIIVSFLLNKFFSNKDNINLFSVSLFIIVLLFFFGKNHFIKNDNQKFYSKLELVSKINVNYDSIERVLIPINIPYIRMNTGLPIFIDWKHHAFKYDEIIMWKKRINLAQKFYETSIFEQQREILMNINKIDFISHILIEKKELHPKCLNLIKHEKFALINASTCYELN